MRWPGSLSPVTRPTRRTPSSLWARRRSDNRGVTSPPPPVPKPVKHAHFRGLHAENRLARLNARIGLKITVLVGTMWTAYVFMLLALIALPSAYQAGLYYIVVWLSSSFLQLVLLPVIIVGQNIQAKHADARSEQTYQTAVAMSARMERLEKAFGELLTRMEF